MGLITAGKKVIIKESQTSENSVSNTTPSALVRLPAGPRGRNTLMNPDGSKMTSEDFVRNGYQMRDTGCAPAIQGFGLSQTALQDWIDQEEASREVKQKDYMFEIKNAKRLIAKYAREERLAWEQNLKDKGLWTEAQELRAQKKGIRDDQELYQRLETSIQMPPMIEPINSRKDFTLSQSVQNVKDILAEVHKMDAEASSQVELQATSQVRMMPQDEAKSENDIGFMTEIDAEYVGKLPASKISQVETDQVNSTRHSDDPATSLPMNPSTRMLVHSS